jgi:branched-chain amino acid transport system substrate-binding protein
MMRRVLMASALAGLLAAAPLATRPAGAADELKIGYMNTFSGPGGILGRHYRDAFDLALEQRGGKLGGLTTQVVYVDDQLKPDVAVTAMSRLLERDKVDLVAGFNFSNVLLAASKPAFNAKMIVISSNAGPSLLAGEGCSPYFFGVGIQNDGAPQSMGVHLQKKGVANVFLIAPNYQAGKDMLTGFKRGYGGKIVGETYTQLSQADFAAELAEIRVAKPAAVFAFMPGSDGINFVKQWSLAGLSGVIPFYSVYTVDHVTLKAIGPAAAGTLGVSQWVEDLPNPENQAFVAAFVKKYAYMPSEYAATAYDTALLIDGAVRAVGGRLDDRAALMAALKKADFKSVRGAFRFNSNQLPIQSYYLREVVKGPDGQLGFVTRELVEKDYADTYAAQCPMK